MMPPSPVVDGRSLQDILTRLQLLASAAVPEWTPPPEGDAGTMIQHIYARLLELAIKRLNEVPEKNLLAFLDAMGVSLIPPAPARAPLTFSLAAGTPPTRVPKGTQAGTQPSGQQLAILFETDDDLTVLPAQLTMGWVIDPIWDRFGDVTAAISGQNANGFTPFVGTEALPHVLYLGDAALLNFARPVTITLTANWKSGQSPAQVAKFFQQLSYRYRSQGQTQTLSIAPTVSVAGNAFQVSFPLVDPVDSETMWRVGLAQSLASRWLQLVLTTPFPDAPVAQDLQLSDLALTVSNTQPLVPDLAFANNAPLDVTKDFLPFGATPKVGDAFYIGSQEAFAKPNSTVTLNVNLKPGDPPVLAWEYWDANSSTWTALPRSSLTDTTGGNTINLTQSGTISMLVPAAVPKGGPAGGAAAWSNLYLRVRLVSGNYRGAPRITKFQLADNSPLKVAAKAGDVKIAVANPSLAAQGQVLLVEKEAVLVTGINGATLNITPALLSDHAAGAIVQVRSTQPLTTLSQPVTPAIGAAPTIKVASSFGMSTDDILMLDDEFNPEFVTVASAPDGNTVVLKAMVRFSHAANVSVARVSPVTLFGFADDDWLDFTDPFVPFGLSPGPGDIFSFQTFAGFFATMVAFDLAATDTGTPGTSMAAGAELRVRSRLDLSLSPRMSLGSIVGTKIGMGGVLVGVNTNPFIILPLSLNPLMRLNINIGLEMILPPIELQWEFLGANGWQAFTPTDNSNKLRSDGPQTIVLPPTVPVLAEVNGQKSYWVRVRITAGNYGLPVSYVAVDPSDPSKGFQVNPGTGNVDPPVITDFSLSYQAQRGPTLATQNSFSFAVQTPQAGTSFVPFVAAEDLTPPIYADADPAFYLAFDAMFPEEPVRLYVSTTPRAFSGSVVKETRTTPLPTSLLPPLRWEYFNGTAWRQLTVIDLTNNFTESGSIEFLTPSDVTTLARFDPVPRYWIRARSSRNDPLATQQLLGVFLNTVSATQAVSVVNETLGSGNGMPDQSLRLVRSPVLAGQQILVREAEPPSDGERAAVEMEEGVDAIQSRPNPVTGAIDTWVRWHEVNNFLSSDPRGRHYTLDHASGTVTFGDGVHGLIPPPGTNNLIATYRTGGGALGNLPPAAVAQVKSPVPGVARVTNPIAADGGADAETVPMVEERGPQTLRHRYRGLSSADLEWLAREAVGTRVARSKCLTNVNRDLLFEPGWATLLIVPSGTGAKLIPGPELTREVETYIATRAFVGLAQQIPLRVNVIGPGYVQVRFIAEVVPQDLDESESVKQTVLSALTAFLHPLTGGMEGTGWRFGRDIYASEAYKVIEDLPGVSHVQNLQLSPNVIQHRLTLLSPRNISRDLNEGSAVMAANRQKAALLAEAISAGSTVNRIAVKGFKEGDRLSKVQDLTVQSVSGSRISVATFTSDGVGFPGGSLVATFDNLQRTRLAQGIPRGDLVSQVQVEDADFASRLNPGDLLTVFYPFPMTVTSVTPDILTLPVLSVSANTIAVAAFNSGAAGLARGTLVSTPDGALQTLLELGIPANQSGTTELIVHDASFVSSLQPGDLVNIHFASQTLDIQPYKTELAFSAGTVLATLDNRVRFPLLADVPGNQAVSSLSLSDWGNEDVVLWRRDAADDPLIATVQFVEPVGDLVYLDDNFLPYSGKHTITMVGP